MTPQTASKYLEGLVFTVRNKRAFEHVCRKNDAEYYTERLRLTEIRHVLDRKSHGITARDDDDMTWYYLPEVFLYLTPVEKLTEKQIQALVFVISSVLYNKMMSEIDYDE